MTDLTITNVGDSTVWSTWTSGNSGDAAWVYVLNAQRRGYVKPQLPNILGRTVLSATLVGHVGPGFVAQTLTVWRVTERWSEGWVTWANQPAVDTTTSVSTVVASALADGAAVEFDVTAHLQTVADGTAWYGWRLGTNSATAGQKFYSSESGEPAWELHVTLSDAPEVPSRLRPDGGAVPTGEPVLAWDFVDLGGDSTVQAALNVQVDTPAVGVDPDEVAPDFDSGWVSSPEPEYDLSTAAYTPPASPPGDTYWRVNVRDGDGNESDWSDWAAFSVAAHPTLVVDSPTGDVGDVNVQVLAHLSGGTVASWRVQAYGPDRSDLRAGSGWQTGTIDWESPTRNRDGRRVFRESEGGWLYLRVHDTVDRATAVGSKTYTDRWIPVTFADAAVVAPTGLTVSQLTPGDPRMVWRWSSTDTADFWLIQVDGDTVARIDGADISPVAGVYTWTDSGHVSALRPHQLRVRAVVGKERSAPATVANHKHAVEGVWLFPDRGGDPIVLEGTDVGGFTRSDRVATYVPMRGPEVDVIYDWEGRVGAFEGTLSSRNSDPWGTLDAIEALRRSRVRTARMIWGSQSMTVRIKDPDATSHPDMNSGNLLHVVRFGFVQVGD